MTKFVLLCYQRGGLDRWGVCQIQVDIPSGIGGSNLVRGETLRGHSE